MMTLNYTIEMANVMLAWANGAKIQHKRFGDKNWTDTAEPDWNFSLGTYRIKPEPKRVPLGPEDVVFGTLLKYKRSESIKGWATPVSVEDCGVRIGSVAALVSWKDLMSEFEISRDSGKTWQPCWKEVEE